MENQLLCNILYMFLDWHPTRIRTFADLIWAVVKSRTILKQLRLKPMVIKRYRYSLMDFDWLKDYFYNMQNISLSMMFELIRERINSITRISVG